MNKEEDIGTDTLRQIESILYLQTIDARWKEHLQSMDHLREGIHMRSYGQRDPKQEYKKEGYRMFATLMTRIRDEVLEKVFKARITGQPEEGQGEVDRLRAQRRRKAAQSAQGQQEGRAAAAAASSANGARPGRGPRISANGSRVKSGAAAATPTPFGLSSGGGDDDDAGLNRAQRRQQKAGKEKRSA